MSRDSIGRLQNELPMFRAAGRAVDTAELNNDQASAAARAFPVKSYLPRADVAFLAELGRHGGHDDPVG
jgi:hypothetical protein